MNEKPWKLVLAYLFFAVPYVCLLIALIVGAMPLASSGTVLMLLCGGFVVAGIGTFPPVAKRKGSVPGPNAAMWVCFFLGVAQWCAAPLVLALGEYGWSAGVGGGGRKMPAWGLAIFTWGTAALMLYAFIRQRMRARRR